MKKPLLIMLSLWAIGGVTFAAASMQTAKPRPQDYPESICVDGILHYRWFVSNKMGGKILKAVTVAVTPEGKPRTCVTQ